MLLAITAHTIAFEKLLIVQTNAPKSATWREAAATVAATAAASSAAALADPFPDHSSWRDSGGLHNRRRRCGRRLVRDAL